MAAASNHRVPLLLRLLVVRAAAQRAGVGDPLRHLAHRRGADSGAAGRSKASCGGGPRPLSTPGPLRSHGADVETRWRDSRRGDWYTSAWRAGGHDDPRPMRRSSGRSGLALVLATWGPRARHDRSTAQRGHFRRRVGGKPQTVVWMAPARGGLHSVDAHANAPFMRGKCYDAREQDLCSQVAIQTPQHGMCKLADLFVGKHARGGHLRAREQRNADMPIDGG